ncbi:MAG: ATP-dependent zinc metalloprotease FtsH, partial [Roseiflexaceae bacterium]
PLLSQLRQPQFWIVMLILLALNGLLVPLLFPEPQDRITVPYTFFKQQVADGNVVEITSRGDAIQGMFKRAVQDPTQAAAANPKTSTKFATQSPTFASDPDILPLLDRTNVVITAEPLEQPRSTLLTVLLSFGPAILLIGGFLWLSARTAGAAGGGLFAFGRSRARRYQVSDVAHPITFADVAGIDEAEHDLVEIVDFLKYPDKYQRLGGRMPRGVLLIGPPGAGKTLLARAVAGEANVPFFSMSGSEFIEMVVGVGAARVRDLFVEARKAAPSIIFVDELDAIGRRRGAGNVMGGNDEREQTLNQLLIEMDGFDTGEVVIVLAATNRSDVLDPALLRPGRFDRRVTVQPPDRAGRAAILQVHTRGVPLAPGTDLNRIAAETPGLVGADLRNLVNEAALLAARNGQDTVSMADFEDALTRIALGAERRLVLSTADRQRVAIHESGHALLGLLQRESDPVRRVTIVPRGQALGVTLSVPDDDRYNYSEAYLRARIVNALGGRAAEELLLDTMTTGAENDLKQATELARAMVTRFGMSQEVGLLSLSGTEEGNFLEQGLIGGNSRPYGEGTADAIDHATRQIIDECYAKARALLAQNQDRLEALAAALLRAESLDEAEMRRVTGLGVLQAPVDALVLDV